MATSLLQPGTFLTWGYDDAAGTLTPTVIPDVVSIRQIIRNVHAVEGGLTEVYDSQASTLTVGLNLDDLIEVGANMVSSYDGTTGVLTIDALGGGGSTGITAAQALIIAIDAVQVGGGITRSSGPDNVILALNNEVMLDTVAAALITSGNIAIDYQDAQNRILFSTDALNETEVDLRINTLVPENRLIGPGGAMFQAWVKNSSTDYDMQWLSLTSNGDLNILNPSFEDQVRAPSRNATARAIADNIGAGSGDNNYVDDITHSVVGQDLTLTLSRSGGLIDLFEVITLPYVDAFTADLTGQDLTMTLGRTGSLADLVQTVTMPATITSSALSLSGQDLTLTVGRSEGNDFRSTVTLPTTGGGAADGVVTGGSVSGTSLTLERSVGADVVITGLPSGGGGTGDTTPVVYLARTAADATDGVQELTLTTALEDGYLLAFDLDIGTGDTLAGRVLVPSALLRALPAQTQGPSADDIDDGYTEACPRLNLTSSLSHATSNVTVWYKDDTHVWILDSRQDMEGVAITGYPMAGGAAGGGGTDTNNYVQSLAFTHTGTDLVLGAARLGLNALSTSIDLTTVVGVPTGLTATETGGDLTITLDRSVGADLTATVALPSSGGGFSLEQIQDAMVSFLNFGNNITDTYNDPKQRLQHQLRRQLCEPNLRQRDRG